SFSCCSILLLRLNLEPAVLCELPGGSFFRLSLDQPEPRRIEIGRHILTDLPQDTKRLECPECGRDVSRSDHFEVDYGWLIAARGWLSGAVEDRSKCVAPGCALCQQRFGVDHHQRVVPVFEFG